MDTILNYLDNQEQKVIELQKNLVSYPALAPENGGEGEIKKAEYLLSYLRQYPSLNIKEFPAEDSRVPSKKRPNIAAILSGREKDRTIWIVSHLDIVPPGDLSLWESDPYVLRQEGDYLFGRGVEDNHQGIVSSILALEAFINTSTEPKTNMGVLLVADEETGNKYGLEFLFKYHKELFTQKDCFLVPDFGSKDSDLIEIAEKGVLWLKIEVLGKQCHASTPEKGINTLVASADLIMRMRRLYKIFDRQDPLFSPPISTFEPTKKQANVPNVNTIPGKDVFFLDCRVLPSYELSEVIETIKKISQETEKEYGVKINFEIVHGLSSPPTDKENEFVKKLAKAVFEEYNTRPKFMGVGGGTVAVYPRKNNIPAAVWATIFGTAHQPNECSSIKNTIKDAKVMARLLL